MQRARQLIDVCRHNGVRLAAIFNRRFVYGTKRTREVVQRGALHSLAVVQAIYESERTGQPVAVADILAAGA